jgi:radical SAM superfamily enzyme YgiQ (UPF0313 family)
MSMVSVAGLITWVWQGAALALLATLVIRGARMIFGEGPASTRYLIWWAVLVAIVVLPLAGRVPSWTTASPASDTAPLSGQLRASSTSTLPGTADRADGHTKVEAVGVRATMGHADPMLTLPPVPGWLATAFLSGWLAFVALRLYRMTRAFGHLARLRRRCRPLSRARQRCLVRWTAQQARGRRTRLAVSDEIAVPALFGITRPMVVIPRPLLDTLTDDELDHVVMHEHAHAQRWDDWGLLAQSCVSAVIGCHLAVWTATKALGRDRYAWASVQTVRGCPKHCSFCSVWRTDGQEPRQRAADTVIEEIVALRRLGFRFIALADDNFYPVTEEDLAQAARRQDPTRLEQLKATRAERFELMARMAELPKDLIFFTQITMEAAEDTAFLDAMVKAGIRGALIGIEAVTPDGLKDVHKGFNVSGEALVTRLRRFREHGVHVLGSFIFGLPSDQAGTFDYTVALAKRSRLDFAQFLTLTPMPGTIDFERWERDLPEDSPTVNGIPMSRYWLMTKAERPRLFTAHPSMSAEEIRRRTQEVWSEFYEVKEAWKRSAEVSGLRNRLTFVLMSKLYRQMYGGTGLAADSQRESRATGWARLLAKPVQRLFAAAPMPELKVPPTYNPEAVRPMAS